MNMGIEDSKKDLHLRIIQFRLAEMNKMKFGVGLELQGNIQLSTSS